jgi:hypothetical protein
MADEQTLTPVDTTTSPTPGNSPEARTPDGTLKNQVIPSTIPEVKPTTDTPTSSEQPITPEDKAKTEGAPEKYVDFTLPEGRTVNKAMLEKALPIFKDLNLSQEQAQKLVAFQTEIDAANAASYEAVRTGWRNEVVKDSTIGNGTDGLNVATNENIGKVIQSLPETQRQPFKDMMNITGVGDNPVMIRALNHLAQFVTEPKPVNGKGPSPLGQVEPGKSATPSIAKAMFPNLPG